MRTNLNLKPKSGNARVALTLLFATAFVACTKGGGITSDSSSSSISGSLAITKIYPTLDGESWTSIVVSNRTFIHGLDMTIKGTCSRGIDTVKVNEGGPDYAQTATCLDDGTFTFNKTFVATAEEGNKTLSVSAYDVTGVAVSGAIATSDVRIDATAPAQLTFTSPATACGSSIVYTGGSTSYPITGGCVSADDVKITGGPNGVDISCSGNTWTDTVALTVGATVPLSYITYDQAGNVAVACQLNVTWNPDVELYQSSTRPGGEQLDIASGFKMESKVGDDSGTTTSSDGSGFKLLSAFNFIINKVRGL